VAPVIPIMQETVGQRITIRVQAQAKNKTLSEK
jgi:hypothetical protein